MTKTLCSLLVAYTMALFLVGPAHARKTRDVIQEGESEGYPVVTSIEVISDVGPLLQINVDAGHWLSMKPQRQKDYIGLIIKLVHIKYPGAESGPVVAVNTGIREVASGRWSPWEGGPAVTLK